MSMLEGRSSPCSGNHGPAPATTSVFYQEMTVKELGTPDTCARNHAQRSLLGRCSKQPTLWTTPRLMCIGSIAYCCTKVSYISLHSTCSHHQQTREVSDARPEHWPGAASGAVRRRCQQVCTQRSSSPKTLMTSFNNTIEVDDITQSQQQQQKVAMIDEPGQVSAEVSRVRPVS